MILFKTFVFLTLSAVCFAGEQDVLELGDSDFDLIAEHETALVMFYAPWCGHCKRLKPEYAKAAGELLKNDPPVVLAKVDCTAAGKDTCSQHSVSGYPTLKIFRNGKLSQEYNGPREADGIVKYMRAQVGPSSKELKSVQELEKFLEKADPVVVGFFKSDSDLQVAFKQVAEKLRERTIFGHSSSDEVLSKQDLSDNVVLFRPKVLHNKFEPNSVTYKGKPDADALQAWIAANTHGLVGVRTRDSAKDFKEPLVVAYYAVDYVKNPKGTNYWRNRILKVAKEFADDFSFAISSKDDFQHELNEFGVDFVKGEKPLVFARNAKKQKFSMSDEFSIENFQKFLTDLKDGKLEPFLKSEPIPEDNSGPVKVAVGKNFDEVVMNNGKDTLVEFYAPWCGHCKKLTPIYDELGEKLKNEDVEIVKVDATANDVPPLFDVRGFPTLYWLPKNSKTSPVRYDGGRELDDFIKYIAEHATEELNGWDRKSKPKKTEL